MTAARGQSKQRPARCPSCGRAVEVAPDWYLRVLECPDCKAHQKLRRCAFCLKRTHASLLDVSGAFPICPDCAAAYPEPRNQPDAVRATAAWLSRKDHVQGGLVGMAVGDALGAPVEFESRDAIAKRYGRIECYVAAHETHALSHLLPGQYTDDTQLGIALAETVIECGSFNPEAFAKKLVAWGRSAENNRLPGATTMQAVARLEEGASWHESGVESAGCGTAMRAAPLGLAELFPDPATVVQAAVNQSRVTHTDARAHAGSAAVALGASWLFSRVGSLSEPRAFGDQVSRMIPEVEPYVRALSPEMADRLVEVPRLLPLDDDLAFEATGSGGLVTETVPAAFFAFLKSPYDFEGVVIRAANAGGDTDSIASIAGALCGTTVGLSNVPARFIEPLENREGLLKLGEELFLSA